jgi:hypothetical protein
LHRVNQSYIITNLDLPSPALKHIAYSRIPLNRVETLSATLNSTSTGFNFSLSSYDSSNSRPLVAFID